HVNITTELTTRATREITIAPRAALILVEPSFKQMVHVAADTPESIAKRIADVGTFTSLCWVMDGRGSHLRCLTSAKSPGFHTGTGCGTVSLYVLPPSSQLSSL